jgi:hypothetical protein
MADQPPKLTKAEREAKRRELLAQREAKALAAASKRAMQHLHVHTERDERPLRRKDALSQSVKDAMNAGFQDYARRISQKAGIQSEFKLGPMAGDVGASDIEHDKATDMDLSVDGRDGPTAEFRKHNIVAKADFKKTDSRAKRNLTTTIWDSYYHRDQLTWRQHQAATLFWGAWYYGGLEQKLTGSYSDAGAGTSDPFWGMAHTEAQVGHRKRLRAYHRDLGPRMASLVVHVICADEPARTWGVLRGKSRRVADAGMELFREALNRIADLEALPDKAPKGSDDMEMPSD